MRAVIFFTLFNFSTLETTISDSNLTKASNMSEKNLTETNVSGINSNSATHTPTENSTIDFHLVLTPIKDLSIPVEKPNETFENMGGNSIIDFTDDDNDIEDKCRENPDQCRLVLGPIEDLSIPVEEPNDTFGKMGKFTSNQRFRPPKKSRDNIQTATDTIDPDFDPDYFNKNYRNTVQNLAISYSLLILIMMK